MDVLPSDILRYIQNAKRKTIKTECNQTSSRSHLIIKLDYVCLIDLMGSETPHDKDGILNNKSLFDLSQLMRQASRDNLTSFRGCKFSMIIKECLLNSRMIIIGCIDETDKIETNRTLQFLKSCESIIVNPLTRKIEEEGVLSPEALLRLEFLDSLLEKLMRIKNK